MSILQTIDLKKYYGTEPNITHALDGVNFSVEDGEFEMCIRDRCRYGRYSRQSAFSGRRRKSFLCQAGPSSAGSAPVPPASPGRAAQTSVFGLPLSHLHSFRGLGISPRYKREAICRECGYTPYACLLYTSRCV